MGDRANVVIKNGDSEVFLYTHWGGTELPEAVTAALRRGVQRWTDASYLARIVFCEMVSEDDWDGLTGYGISASIGDNSYPLIVLDTDKQEVRFEAEKDREVLKGPIPFKEVLTTALEYPGSD